jgi:hypothetical protein
MSAPLAIPKSHLLMTIVALLGFSPCSCFVVFFLLSTSFFLLSNLHLYEAFSSRLSFPRAATSSKHAADGTVG